MKNEFEIRGDHAVIFINTKKHGIMETKVSLDGLVKAQSFENVWTGFFHSRDTHVFRVVGTLTSVNEANKRVYLSRWLMGDDSKLHVDHINGDTLDNRFENLRWLTNSMNLHNQSRTSTHNKTTGFKGVSYIKSRKRYHAYSMLNYKKIHLGFFKDVEEAKNKVIEYKKSLGIEVRL